MANVCDGFRLIDRINKTDCIGNSLVTINSNFIELDKAICRAENAAEEQTSLVASSFIPNLAQVRLSLHASMPYVTTDIKNAETIYLLPYKGSLIGLWNSTLSKWEIHNVTSVQLSLVGCLANSSYDVFLYHDGVRLQLELVPWPSHTEGAAPDILETKSGVYVKTNEPNKRLVGCIRTNSSCRAEMSFGKTAASGGSHPKLFVWNAQNQKPVGFSILDSGVSGGAYTWSTTGDGDNATTNEQFERLGSSSNNRVSFITRDHFILNMISTHVTENSAPFYFIHSLNMETPTVTQFLAKTPGTPIYENYGNQTMSHASGTLVSPGYHYIQLATMTYLNQPVKFNLWAGNRHSYGTVGNILTF